MGEVSPACVVSGEHKGKLRNKQHAIYHDGEQKTRASPVQFAAAEFMGCSLNGSCENAQLAVNKLSPTSHCKWEPLLNVMQII